MHKASDTPLIAQLVPPLLACLAIAAWTGEKLPDSDSTELHAFAMDTTRTMIAGYGIGSDLKWKGLVWRRGADGAWKSFVLFDPMTMQGSQCNATDGVQVGGHIKDLTGRIKATIWTKLEPNAMKDLHPHQFQVSSINGMDNGIQVGFAVDGTGRYHAAVWFNEKESFYDLQSVLPAEFTESTALAVSSNPTRIIGGAKKSNGEYRAVVWRLE